MNTQRTFDFFELHDAILESITLDLAGSATLEFRFVSLYFAKAPQVYEVWIARAALRLVGLSDVTIGGAVKPDVLVMGARFRDNSGSDIGFRRCGESIMAKLATIESLEYQMSFKCKNAVLDTLVMIDQTDDWIGSLKSSGSA